MQKVYLLLRSNKQTGPYSLEELLQLNLKPFDLVWMEGRSAAWQYPFEIPSLKPYVPETPHADAPFKPIATSVMEEKAPDILQVNVPLPPQNPIPQRSETPKRVFVSVPKTFAAREQTNYSSNQETNSFKPEHTSFMPQAKESLYEKQEDVKPVSSSVQPSSLYSSQKPLEGEVHTNYARSLNDVEEDYTNWVYKQKTKKKPGVNPKDLALAVLILAVIVGGYYVMSKPSVANSVLPSGKAATINNSPQTENQLQGTESEEILSTEQKITSAADENSNHKVETKPKRINTKNPQTVSNSQTNSSVPQVQAPIPVVKTNPNIHDNKNEIGANEPVAQQPSKQNTPLEKKKKLGEVLKGIFTKKEKKDESNNEAPVMEDPKPATNRQATRREAEEKPTNENASSNEINTVNLMEQVELYSNAPSSWMMGVKNLKITLKNRSDVTIQAASVTVNYYNENDELLEKKMIYFSNVAPRSKAIVSAPDQKFADHVDFKLTTVTAKEDRYAKY